jgi:hypothetical protein
MCLFKMCRHLQMLFAAVAHLDERLSLETLLTLKVEKCLSCLVGIWRPTIFIIE